MAVHLTWAPVALQDLEEIVAYIRRDNPTAAQVTASSLIEKIELLSHFPDMGRIMPEQDDSLVREMIHQTYRIIYRRSRDGAGLEVIRIWHAARGEPEI